MLTHGSTTRACTCTTGKLTGAYYSMQTKVNDFICIYIHALRTLSVFGACLAEISTFDLTLTKIENDQIAVALELGYVSDDDSQYHNFKKEAIVPHKELYVDLHILSEDLFHEAERSKS